MPKKILNQLYKKKNVNFTEKGKQNNLEEKELLDIVSIVDLGPKHLNKINLENIDEVIDQGEQKIIEKRKKINSPDWSAEEMFKKIQNSSSKSHAIQCSINGTEDFKALKAKIHSEKILGFLQRHIKMKELLTQLYKIDIMRRIGIEKNQKEFFEKGLKKFEKIKEELKNSIEEFELENEGKIDLEKTIKELKESLFKEDLESTFYERMCQSYSELIFNDFEKNHEKEIEKIIKCH